MIFDIEALEKDKVPKIVIIGSGPAGITLAKNLADRGIDNLILEAGDLEYSELAQDTCTGSVIGDHYWDLKSSHLKFFGGTSNHWTGVCRPLDDVDFESRPDLQEHIGWPISKSDIDAYSEEARSILEVPEMRWARIDEHIKEVEFACSPPVRFGTKYLEYFKKSSKAHVCLNANVVSLSAENGRITHAIIARPDKSSVEIKTDHLVICAGGIDNSRLLLWSNEVSPEPVVKNKNILGKYWFEHPHNKAGEVFLVDRINKFYFNKPWALMFFSPTVESMKEHKILNACLRLQANFEHEHLHKDWSKNLAWRAVCTSKPLSDQLLSLAGKQIQCTNSIEMVWEQEPRENNKITLSETEKDVFGVPRPVLHWSKSKLDYRTPKVMMELFGRYLLQNKLGYIRLSEHMIREGDYPAGDWMAGNHHMGGTRMSDNPNEGVVDSNLKIFGTDNAYILGSSVFPKGGHANPTFTIVQLSLRLADYLSAIK